MNTAYLILLAAGSGTRMQSDQNKVFLPLNGHPVLWHTLRTCEASNCFQAVFLVYREGEKEIVDSIAKQVLSIPYTLVVGGESRQDSVYHAIQRIPDDAAIICIHDVARCFAPPSLFSACVSSAEEKQSGVAAKHATDTVKCAKDGIVLHTLDRNNIALIETPQAFQANLIKKAYDTAYRDGFFGTDDASLVERIGEEVHLVFSNYINMKLTHPQDFALANTIIQTNSTLRIGHGYDVHALSPGRKLIIGGVTIESEFGLQGHSDADVLVHAIMDALLGAAGLKDIGYYFPDNDPAFLGISSILLLEQVGKLLLQEQIEIINIDATVVLQTPKIMKFHDQMKNNIANALSLTSDQVNLKATTSESLGFTGRKEGASATAVCLIKKYDKILEL